jgi:hypothetical protein
VNDGNKGGQRLVRPRTCKVASLQFTDLADARPQQRCCGLPVGKKRACNLRYESSAVEVCQEYARLVSSGRIRGLWSVVFQFLKQLKHEKPLYLSVGRGKQPTIVVAILGTKLTVVHVKDVMNL